jgi:hypothetical protein
LRKLMVLLAAVLVALAASTAATAGDWPNATFDAVATEVAGHPVHAYCEDSNWDWESLTHSVGIAGGDLYGFAPYGGNVLFVSPLICESLHIALEIGYQDAGLAHFSRALLVLIHESMHSRGIVDEGEADCTALPLVAPMAVKYFKVPQTVSQLRVVTRFRKVGKKRVKVQVVVQQQVPNPDLARLQAWAKAWHDAAPPAYRGNC